MSSGAILEFLDEDTVGGIDVEGGEWFELYIEPEITAVSVDVVDFLEFDDGRGPRGPAGPAGTSYVHTQSSPAATWTVSHGLNRYPSVAILIDSSPGELVYTDVSYPDSNTIVVEFPSPETGTVNI